MEVITSCLRLEWKCNCAIWRIMYRGYEVCCQHLPISIAPEAFGFNFALNCCDCGTVVLLSFSILEIRKSQIWLDWNPHVYSACQTFWFRVFFHDFDVLIDDLIHIVMLHESATFNTYYHLCFEKKHLLFSYNCFCWSFLTIWPIDTLSGWIFTRHRSRLVRRSNNPVEFPMTMPWYCASLTNVNVPLIMSFAVNI